MAHFPAIGASIWPSFGCTFTKSKTAELRKGVAFYDRSTQLPSGLLMATGLCVAQKEENFGYHQRLPTFPRRLAPPTGSSLQDRFTGVIRRSAPKSSTPRCWWSITEIASGNHLPKVIPYRRRVYHSPLRFAEPHGLVVAAGGPQANRLSGRVLVLCS
jgi:hypothetical protein